MLLNESILIKGLLNKYSNKKIINLCSSDYHFYKHMQPYIYKNIIFTLIENNNEIIHLDIKSGNGIDITSNCEDMKSIQDNTFDLVLFFSCIEHLNNPLRAIKEIYRIVKPTGTLLASAPGDYPLHNDPIDNMIRLPSRKSWDKYISKYFEIESFFVTEKQKSKEKYNYSNLVYSTIIEAKPISNQ